MAHSETRQNLLGFFVEAGFSPPVPAEAGNGCISTRTHMNVFWSFSKQLLMRFMAHPEMHENLLGFFVEAGFSPPVPAEAGNGCISNRTHMNVFWSFSKQSQMA